MRIDEGLANAGEPFFSFEFFPPRTDEGRETLFETLRTLSALEPSFVSVTYGAGGATRAAELAAEGIQDPGWAAARAKRCLEAGAYMIMIESEGITENVKSWRTDVPAKFVNSLGLEKVMFEAAEPEVFA